MVCGNGGRDWAGIPVTLRCNQLPLDPSISSTVLLCCYEPRGTAPKMGPYLGAGKEEKSCHK